MIHATPREAGAIEVRNIHFDIPADVPRYWYGGQKAITTFVNNMSIFFPAGERFFIASVRAHQKHVQDAKLNQQVRAFCAQEGIHSREHEAYNEMLERQGYPVPAMLRRVETLLGRVSKRLPKRWQLGATCALEHFTALMAHMAIDHPRAFEGAHPTMTALWRWHAAEENEHKSVAYDVYLAAGGHYVERAMIMAGATLIFWARVFEQQVRMMRCDGTVFSPGEWGSLAWFLFGQPGLLRHIFPLYLQYYRPTFHPRDLDCSEAIERWKREFETSAIYRTAA